MKLTDPKAMESQIKKLKRDMKNAMKVRDEWDDVIRDLNKRIAALEKAGKE